MQNQMRKRVFDMEMHVMIVLPDGFLEKLGIDDETLVESYVGDDSIHINLYAESIDKELFLRCDKPCCDEDCACCPFGK